MATFNSTEMTNLLAASPTLTPVAQWGGRMRVAGGNFEMDATIVATDIIRLCRLPSNARVWKIELGGDNLGTAAVFNVGVYQDDGTVVDADEFASSVILDSKVYSSIDVLATPVAEIVYEAAATDIVYNGLALWQRAALSADPGGMYDICLTAVTITTAAAGTIAYSIWYTVD